jgi:hypothetical protein
MSAAILEGIAVRNRNPAFPRDARDEFLTAWRPKNVQQENIFPRLSLRSRNPYADGCRKIAKIKRTDRRQKIIERTALCTGFREAIVTDE